MVKYKSKDFWFLRKIKFCKELNFRILEKILFILCWSCLLNCSNIEKLWYLGVERFIFILILLLCWLILVVIFLLSVFVWWRNCLVNLRVNLILLLYFFYFYVLMLFRCLDLLYVYLLICLFWYFLVKVWIKFVDDIV